jgi:predicted ATPase/class 3 adenylate cyclase
VAMQICPNCGEENPPKFRLCGYCGSPLAPALPAQEVRKTVSIVFSDLKGSTNLGEALDSEALREVMNRYFEEMRAALLHHGGTIEKYIGDAVMAVFGLPTLHEDDALRAVRAAAEMQRRLAELNDELERVWGVQLTNRTGVNTGEVVAGDPTTGQRLVTGDAVNVAARLEQAAPAMEVLLGDLTYQLVRDAVEVEEVEPLELKGKSERVPAYRLVSVSEIGEGVARRTDSPMVGRESELATLLSAFEEALAARACRLVTVIGEAGVGKSRLHDEFMQIAGESAQILRGRCLSYGEGITFWPLLGPTRQAGGIRDDDPPDVAIAKLAALLGEGRDDVVLRVAAAIGVSNDPFPIEELFWGIRKFVELLARERPLVLLFDDIHWAEPTFLDLIEDLLDSLEDAPVLVLGPARHELLEERPHWAERPSATRIVLERLSDTDSERVVEGLLGDAGLADDVKRRIVDAAEGNPLFVEQMLSMLVDSDALRLEDGRYVATEALAELSVPPTINALLSARLDTLAAEERAVIEPASVIGVLFACAAVQELAPETITGQVPARLASLATKQFVRDAPELVEKHYRFNHVLIRDAAYNGLLKRARATFHERFVQWADRFNRERGRESEFEEILGYHLEQAHRYLSELGPLDDHGLELGRRAAERLTSAARRAFARGDMPAATNLFRRVTVILPEDGVQRLELLPTLAEALFHTGEYRDAASILQEATERAERMDHPTVRAKAKLIALAVGQHTGELENWSDEVERESAAAMELFETTGDHGGLAKAWQLLGYLHGNACRFGEMAAAFARAAEHAGLAGDTKLETRCVTQYALALVYGPTPARDAIKECERIVAQVSNDRQAQANILSCLASLEGMLGEIDTARQHYAQARMLLEDLGLLGPAASMSLQTGRVETLAGDFQAAEKEFRRGYDGLEQLGERYFRSTVASLLAGVLYEEGRYEEAESFRRIGAELAAADDIGTQALLHALHAKLQARQGQGDEAEALVAEALSLLSTTDFTAQQVEALLDRAEVLKMIGRASAARVALEEAIRLAEAKQTVPYADRARALLESLPAEAEPAASHRPA